MPHTSNEGRIPVRITDAEAGTHARTHAHEDYDVSKLIGSFVQVRVTEARPLSIAGELLPSMTPAV